MVAKTIVIQPPHPLPPRSGGIEPRPTLDMAFMISINFAVLSAIAAAMYAYRPKSRQPTSGGKSHHQVLCYRCRYFGDDPHLRCALHPITVMTAQAADCADYEPQSQTK
jgi:hypothetical protein